MWHSITLGRQEGRILKQGKAQIPLFAKEGLGELGGWIFYEKTIYIFFTCVSRFIRSGG
jgi:hypothetical protein